MSSAEFIAECYKIDIKWARMCAQFFPSKMEWITIPQIWVRGDIIRVYFEVESQNKQSAIKGLKKCYYSPVDDEIYFDVYMIYGLKRVSLKNLVRMRGSIFSGAKTLAGLKKDCEVFENEKRNRSDGAKCGQEEDGGSI